MSDEQRDDQIENWIREREEKPSPVESAAVRKHVSQPRSARAHIIVTYEVRKRVGDIIDVFRIAERLDDDTLNFIHRELIMDLLEDIRIYRAELDDIERWARAQLTKKPTPVRE